MNAADDDDDDAERFERNRLAGTGVGVRSGRGGAPCPIVVTIAAAGCKEELVLISFSGAPSSQAKKSHCASRGRGHDQNHLPRFLPFFFTCIRMADSGGLHSPAVFSGGESRALFALECDGMWRELGGSAGGRLDSLTFPDTPLKGATRRRRSGPSTSSSSSSSSSR